METLARISADRRLLGWCLVVAFSLPPGLGFLGFHLREVERTHWGSREDSEVLDRAKREFSFAAPLALVLECDEFFEPTRGAALRDAVAELKQLPGVQQVMWIGDIAEFSLTGGRDPLLPDKNAEASEFPAASRKAHAHPLVADHLLSRDGSTMVILVEMWDESLVDTVRNAVRNHLAPVGVRVRATGPVALQAAYSTALKEDHIRLQLTAYGLVAVLAIIIFRRPMAIIVAGSGPIIGVVWTMGWLRLLGEPHNDLAQIILPVLIMMIGFTDGMHIVVYIRQLRARGESLRNSTYRAVQHVGPACFLTSLTTAIGFGSLQFSDSGMVAGFGRVSAIGVIVTFFAVNLITPLLANSFFGKNLHIAATKDLVGRLMLRGTPLFRLVNRHARLVANVGIALTVVLLILAFQLNPDDRLTDRVPRGSEAREAMLHCDRVIGGVRYIRLLVSWSKGKTPDEIWRVIAEWEKELQSEPLIGKPISIRTCLSLFRGEDSQSNPLLVGLLPAELRNRFYQPQSRTAQVVARLQDRGIATYEPVFARLNDRMSRHELESPGFQAEVTSDLIIEGRIVRRMVSDLVVSLMMASVVIFIVLGVAFRSFRLALISIIPNVFPLAATGAIRLWIDSSLDIASACSFAICLGIAVDDTIHYLNRFRVEKAAGATSQDANERTVVSVGSALVMTTAVMLAGMGTVVTSQLPTHSNFAAMGCATLAAALVADLIFLPAMLVSFRE